jgi:hypothetical protein
MDAERSFVAPDRPAGGAGDAFSHRRVLRRILGAPAGCLEHYARLAPCNCFYLYDTWAAPSAEDGH